LLLRLNEDLIEAIALGHDIGHAPFGHDGEKFLSDLSREYGLGNFLHNVQGVRFLEVLEKKGAGWNLSLQVLDGILMADTISYIGRDIEDAIRLGLIKRNEIPPDCRRRLGETNGTIVYTLVEDLISESLEKPSISFSPEVADALGKLKDFNQEFIYADTKAKSQTEKLRLMFELLFEKYYRDLKTGNDHSVIFREFLDGMSSSYRDNNPPAMIVRDFIAGMTDDYFLRQCQENLMPRILSGRYENHTMS